jgi:dihydroxy-acid dehydratase
VPVIHLEVSDDELAPAAPDAAAQALRARLWMVQQADTGCDFDFLETSFGAISSDIY